MAPATAQDASSASSSQPTSPFFLSLAPATSSSYPRLQASSAAGVVPQAAAKPRRSSSLSSGYKVLKLGPVHWGEHQDEHKDDFYELSSA
jgi:hypothetical protein